MHIRRFEEPDRQEVIALWERCGLVVPANDPNGDIDRKMSFQPTLFFVAELENRIVGSVMAGYEGHRGWINYLAVAPEHQRRGLGRGLMIHAEEVLAAIGCPKVNLQTRSENAKVVAFYEAIGYTVENRISLGKRQALS